MKDVMPVGVAVVSVATSVATTAAHQNAVQKEAAAVVNVDRARTVTVTTAMAAAEAHVPNRWSAHSTPPWRQPARPALWPPSRPWAPNVKTEAHAARAGAVRVASVRNGVNAAIALSAATGRRPAKVDCALTTATQALLPLSTPSPMKTEATQPTLTHATDAAAAAAVGATAAKAATTKPGPHATSSTRSSGPTPLSTTSCSNACGSRIPGAVEKGTAWRVN